MNKKKPKRTEFVIVWEFRVRSGKRREFERVYGPDGAWAELFRGGKGYIRTELLHDLETPRRYLTIDFWTSRQAYLRFKKNNRAEYQTIDAKCLSLTEDEVKIGEFYGIFKPKATAVASLKGLGHFFFAAFPALTCRAIRCRRFATGGRVLPTYRPRAEL